MASRKKRSSSKAKSKKQTKSTKRQFLAAPQFLAPTGAFPSFALPAAPFVGAALPFFPSFPQAPPQQQMIFKPSAFPTFTTKMQAPTFTTKMQAPTFTTKMQAPTGFSGMKMGALRASQMPVSSSPYSGFPSTQKFSPFVKVPQFQNANFFSGTPSGPLNPGAPMRESMPGMLPCFSLWKILNENRLSL